MAPLASSVPTPLLINAVHAYSEISISINNYLQKARESENDAWFLKVIIIAAAMEPKGLRIVSSRPSACGKV